MPVSLLLKIGNPLVVSMCILCVTKLCTVKGNTLMENNAKLFPQISHAIFDSEEMMNTTATVTNGMKDVLSDSFKFGLYSVAVLTLHIILLIALIVFAISGTAAYICSITNCRHFFTGTGGQAPQGRQPSFPPYFDRRNDIWKSWDDMKPVAQSLQQNYDKYNAGVVENY